MKVEYYYAIKKGLDLEMNKILGLSIIALGVFLEVMWLGVCFGTVIIGILLLFFAPRILFFPFNFFLLLGLAIINPLKYSQAREFKYNYKQSNGFNQVRATSSSKLSEYYETLESNKTDTMDIIKKNYRRLIKEYHYDSIASKNLPEEMVKFSQEKTQALNEAYAAIKEYKK